MNKEVKELMLMETSKQNRFIVIPGIYQHFKEVTDSKERMIYAVSNISVPISQEEMDNMCKGLEIFYSYGYAHTELNENIRVIRIEDRYYHLKEVESDMLVIYSAMYGYRTTYVRPLNMFISKVDEGRESNQTYRFEII